MTLAGRLALPAIVGGIAALIASGVFLPPVQAKGSHADTIAQITAIADGDQLHVRARPAQGAEKIGKFSGKSLVWIEHCAQGENATDWCLIERSGIKGWVDARYLTPHWD